MKATKNRKIQKKNKDLKRKPLLLKKSQSLLNGENQKMITKWLEKTVQKFLSKNSSMKNIQKFFSFLSQNNNFKNSLEISKTNKMTFWKNDKN